MEKGVNRKVADSSGTNVKLKPGAWIHFVAIGGTGMGALAGLLKDSGYRVTGSDGVLYPPMSVFLDSKQIPRKESYTADNLKGENWGFKKETFPDLVIVGNAISRNHVEAQEVERLLTINKLSRMSFAQGLAEFAIGNRKSFVVAGTHGKTTTTSLLTWMLETLGMSPGYFIGGIPKNFGKGCDFGKGTCFVSEGDEYDTAYWDKKSKFLHYRPSWVLCTGVEFDHVDIFSSVDMIVNSFCELVEKTREGWLLIDSESAPLKDPVEKIAKCAKEKSLKLLRYGYGPHSHYQILDTMPAPLPWNPMARGLKIKIKTPQWGVVEFVSPMPGRHNALNTLGVIATCLESGELKNPDQVQQMLKTFAGIKRRQDEVKVEEKFVVIDDFAHHPTAIKETIGAIKGKYPDSKIAAFFEARSATSSRKVFEKEFTECFDEADVVFLSPPTKTNIPENEKLNIDNVIKGLQSRKSTNFVHSKKEIDDLLLEFKKWSQSADIKEKPVVALVMSNGPFQGIFEKIARK